MTVRELINRLSGYPDKTLVVLCLNTVHCSEPTIKMCKGRDVNGPYEWLELQETPDEE